MLSSYTTLQLAFPQLLDTESEADDTQTYPRAKALVAKQHSKWKQAHTRMPYSSLDVRTASSEEASINSALLVAPQLHDLGF